MDGVPVDDEGHLRQILDYLGHELDPSILIGGWATFEMVGGEISKDIDLIIGSPEVRAKVGQRVADLSKSSHRQGRKWRGLVDGVHVDIYLPHESQLGEKLRLKVGVLAEHTEPATRGAWKLLSIEAHTLTKMAALLDRPDSQKGAKDADELLRLLRREPDAHKACAILVEAAAVPPANIPDLVRAAFLLVAEKSTANKGDRRYLEKIRRIWVEAAQFAVAAPQRERPPLL
ncbi:MAG: hypothetical protein Q8P61_06030 [Candidatus Nanopelagicales bacterium]|nr:hypothetical protein [Candidatus Nanopelagicales bacterium]